MTSDSKQIKYWNLDKDPSLITTYSVVDSKIDLVYCTLSPVDEKELFYFVIVKSDHQGFSVCKNKLEEIWKYEGERTTTCIEFT